MDKFTSYFELIAALNFAFIISTHFINSISSRVSEQYNKIKGVLKSIIEIQSANYDFLISCQKSLKNNSVVLELNDKHEKIQIKVDDLDTAISSLGIRSAKSLNFNYLCLFGALYTTFMLLIIGFEFNLDQFPCKLSFLVFNISAIITLSIVMNLEGGMFGVLKSGYFQIIMLFIILLLSSTLIGIVAKSYCDITFDYTLLNKIMAILIPSAHFVYFFFLTIMETKKESLKYTKSLTELKSECEEFAKELSHKIDVVNKMHILTESSER